MTSRIRPASRSQAKPLIGFYSESGGGKTYSALLLARGFIGPQGKICMIETESGRGEAYADPNEYPEIGGYDVLPLRDDFSPTQYGQAITEVEKGGYNALIIDSASHEWEGAGGVLDMAAKKQASGSKGPLVWQQAKIDHQRHFMLRFMQTPISIVILCMRAKYPMEEVIQNGKKEWARSKVLEPKQSEDILYEMFVHGWFDQAHKFHPTKITGGANSDLRKIFVDDRMITLDTGSRLSSWAKGLGTPKTTPNPTPEYKTEKDPEPPVNTEAAQGIGPDDYDYLENGIDTAVDKSSLQKALDAVVSAGPSMNQVQKDALNARYKSKKTELGL